MQYTRGKALIRVKPVEQVEQSLTEMFYSQINQKIMFLCSIQTHSVSLISWFGSALTEVDGCMYKWLIQAMLSACQQISRHFQLTNGINVILLPITNVENQISPEDSCYVTWQIKKVARLSLPEGNYQLVGWQATYLTYVIWMVSPPSSCSPVDSPKCEMKACSLVCACLCALHLCSLWSLNIYIF